MLIKRAILTATFAVSALAAAWLAAPAGARPEPVAAAPVTIESVAPIDDGQPEAAPLPWGGPSTCTSSGGIPCAWVKSCQCCICNGSELTGAENGDEVSAVESISLPAGSCSKGE